MPSIIGNSIIIGGGGGKTGPTGPVGPIGPTGPIGATSSNIGPTGPTGTYIIDVMSDLINNTITFYPSDSTASISIFGFTGSNSTVSDSRGVCNSQDIFAITPFSIISGTTFEIFGISGSGLISSSLSADKKEIILTISPDTGLDPIYGNTGMSFVVYAGITQSASNTRIGVTGSNSVLSFGLTAHNGATGDSIKVYTDIADTFYECIYGITLGYQPSSIKLDPVVIGADAGGLQLDLNSFTTYKFTTPIGITSFIGSSISTGVVQSCTFFIEGSDVWNFPKNVKFENTSSGISDYGFMKGMNILHLIHDVASPYWYAAFTARGIGVDDVVYSSNVGSCLYDNQCIDYTSPSKCTELGGVFSPTTSCVDTIGDCCIAKNCYTNVPKSICSNYQGIFSSSGSNCNNTCTGPSYSIIITDQKYPNKIVVPDSDKLFTVTILTTDTNPVYFHFPDSVGQFQSFQAKLSNGSIISNGQQVTSGMNFGLYFTNTLTPTIKGSSASFPLVLRSGPDPLDSKLAGVTLTLAYYPLGSGCRGNIDASIIKTKFKSNRYCVDCRIDTGSGLYYYPVQSQTGNLSFCVSNNLPSGITIYPLCASSGNYTNLNNCSISQANNPDEDAKGTGCYHMLYPGATCITNIDGGWNCDQIALDLGGSVLQQHCKGHTYNGGGNSAYWHDIVYPDSFIPDLNIAGITTQSDIDYVLNYIKNSSDLINDYRLFNVDPNTSYVGGQIWGKDSGDFTNCCQENTTDVGVFPVNFFNPTAPDPTVRSNYKVFLLTILSENSTIGKCNGAVGNGGFNTNDQPCTQHQCNSKAYAFVMRAKAWADISCVNIIPLFDRVVDQPLSNGINCSCTGTGNRKTNRVSVSVDYVGEIINGSDTILQNTSTPTNSITNITNFNINVDSTAVNCSEISNVRGTNLSDAMPFKVTPKQSGTLIDFATNLSYECNFRKFVLFPALCSADLSKLYFKTSCAGLNCINDNSLLYSIALGANIDLTKTCSDSWDDYTDMPLSEVYLETTLGIQPNSTTIKPRLLSRSVGACNYSSIEEINMLGTLGGTDNPNEIFAPPINGSDFRTIINFPFKNKTFILPADSSTSDITNNIFVNKFVVRYDYYGNAMTTIFRDNKQFNTKSKVYKIYNQSSKNPSNVINSPTIGCGGIPKATWWNPTNAGLTLPDSLFSNFIGDLVTENHTVGSINQTVDFQPQYGNFKMWIETNSAGITGVFFDWDAISSASGVAQWDLTNPTTRIRNPIFNDVKIYSEPAWPCVIGCDKWNDFIQIYSSTDIYYDSSNPGWGNVVRFDTLERVDRVYVGSHTHSGGTPRIMPNVNIKAKLIDHTCISIDCTGIEMLCSELEDC